MTTTNLYLFAVALTYNYADPNYAWIEFYWAEDSDHAKEQAKNGDPDAIILACGFAPGVPPYYEVLALGETPEQGAEPDEQVRSRVERARRARRRLRRK